MENVERTWNLSEGTGHGGRPTICYSGKRENYKLGTSEDVCELEEDAKSEKLAEISHEKKQSANVFVWPKPN
jgi:hypothetical protein